MSSVTARTSGAAIEQAVLETLAYFDVFDFPVRADELNRYLHGVRATLEELLAALQALAGAHRIEARDGYYVLSGRGDLIDRYQAAARNSARRLHLAIRYGRLLARLPFISMVAVTGSVSMRAGDDNADFDYLLVSEPGRLWLARLFAVAVGRLARFRGHTLCPNILLSERALIWPRQDVYSAHELTQMIPVSGLDAYKRLRQLNAWTSRYLPNASGAPFPQPTGASVQSWLRNLVEAALRTPLGSLIENAEMRRKIRRFRRQAGFGSETLFSADVCQGNFQNHGGRIRHLYEDRLTLLGLTSVLIPGSSTATSPRLAGPRPEAVVPARVTLRSAGEAAAHD